MEPNIEWLVGRAGSILVEHGRVAGLAFEDGERHTCRALVVTTGTFLNGLIHIGDQKQNAGRMGEKASVSLADNIKDFGFRVERLKTGTPPRVNKRSIDYSLTEEQPGDADVRFSFDEQEQALMPASRHSAASISSA